MDSTDLRYPIGKFRAPTSATEEQINSWIEEIARFPDRLKAETELLSREELDYRYRPEGWTIRQVVHHLADSHMNSLMRFKLALTEEKPVIRPYHENLWAELADSKESPLSSSMEMLHGLHQRWVFLLRNMKDDQFHLEFVHPEYNKTYKLYVITALYAWHGNHHLAHIRQAKKRKDK